MFEFFWQNSYGGESLGPENLKTTFSDADFWKTVSSEPQIKNPINIYLHKHFGGLEIINPPLATKNLL